ncbi:MAG: hypothetical protein IJO85_01320 [Lachnospiraceae bacterium]|nr:hypothetical protein [Lachnospiraceae bacterium]
MQEKLIGNNEKVGNLCMLGFICVVAVVGTSAVMLFLNGGIRELVFPLGGVFAILVKLVEKRLGSNARYVYALIPPIIGAITNAVCSTPDSESYIATTFYYMAATVLVTLYLDLKLLMTNGIATFVINLVTMLIFPAGFLKLHNVIGWLFFWIFYFILLAGCYMSVYRTNYLFGVVEEKGEEMKNVLAEVQNLSNELYTAGTTLSSVSENESASAEELAATSVQLVESSNMLSSKTDESMSNLGELSEWESVVTENVEKVEAAAKDLLDKSVENEKLLNDLHSINGEVSDSMNATNEITKRLSEAVQEIGVTLSLISDISNSTNLLALNASIEAARAGEAGRGFAVVATEVGSLANSTQESLKVVQGVIERVQQNVREITAQVQENAAKMGKQNEYFENVFACMKDMTELMNISVNVIGTMGEAHSKQAEVIKRTVSINQDIAESIRNENEQFHSINAMAEGNANDTTNVAMQAGIINEMVDKIADLLKQNEV